VSLPLILKVYNLSPETLSLATKLICIHNGCAILIWPLSFTLPNALRASNDVKYTMVVAILSMWIFRIMFSYVLGKWLGWGAIGVWVAMVLDWICRATMFVARYLSGKWTTK
jgi:Na+-driven multidrug efflux pump